MSNDHITTEVVKKVKKKSIKMLYFYSREGNKHYLQNGDISVK